MSHQFLRLAASLSLCLGLIAAVHAGQPQATTATVGVAGRANSTPSLAADGDFVALAFGAKGETGNPDVYLATSRDGGATFGEPVRVNATPGTGRLGGEMPPLVGLTKASTGTPVITLLWTAKTEAGTEIRTSRSIDGGRTFTGEHALQRAGAAGDRGWPSLSIDGNGVAHAMWLDHRGLAKPAAGEHAGHHMASSEAEAADGVAMAMKSGLYYSSGGGERELTKGVCYCCKTALATGANGTIVAAWRHVYAGNLRDIAFTVSRDGGRTFATPARVSEDQWQLNGCPDDGPAMAIDGAGSTHIVWPTVIDGPEPEGAIFYSVSTDGRAFRPRVRVKTLGSPRPLHPQIAIDGTGRIVAAWDEVVAGARHAIVRPMTEGAPAQDLGPGTYPVMAATRAGLLAAWVQDLNGATRIALARVP